MLDPMPSERREFRLTSHSAIYARCYDSLIGDAAEEALAAGWNRARRFFSPPLECAVDIACGTGRFLPELARIARQVYAVDRSPAMLAMARKHGAGLNVRFFQQDFRNLHLPNPCDFGTCRFASINYIVNRRDMNSTFDSFRRTIRPNGLLLFDVIIKPADCGKPLRSIQNVTQGIVRSRWDYFVDPCQGVSKTQISWIAPGHAPQTEVHQQRWYHEAEIARLLKRHGFHIVDRFWLPRGGPDNWLQLIARRRDEQTAS
jgi:SAM-dependent methyltransferase